MLSKLKAHVVRKREIYSKERFKEEENLYMVYSVLKTICRLKVKVIKNKKEEKGDIGCGGTHL